MCRYLASRRPCVAVGVVTGSFSSVRRDRLVVTAYGSAGGSDGGRWSAGGSDRAGDRSRDQVQQQHILRPSPPPLVTAGMPGSHWSRLKRERDRT